MRRFTVSGQALKDGQGEGGGLARARLGDAQKVLASHNARNGLCLNGGGLGVPLVGKCLEQGLVEAEVGKLSQNFMSFTNAPKAAAGVLPGSRSAGHFRKAPAWRDDRCDLFRALDSLDRSLGPTRDWNADIATDAAAQRGRGLFHR